MTRQPRRRLVAALALVMLAGCASQEVQPAAAPPPDATDAPAPTEPADHSEHAVDDEHAEHDEHDDHAEEEATELFGTPVPAEAEAHDHGEVEMAALPSSDVPTRLQIPAIGVDATTISSGLEADGSMEVPEGTEETSWFTHSPTPGELGASVILGHVDSTAGPAVFYRLRELTAGAEIVVTDEAGADHRFVVDEVAQYPKDGLPTDEVFGYVREPVLRLITCGGDFDPGRGHYDDNVVVYASLA